MGVLVGLAGIISSGSKIKFPSARGARRVSKQSGELFVAKAGKGYARSRRRAQLTGCGCLKGVSLTTPRLRPMVASTPLIEGNFCFRFNPRIEGFYCTDSFVVLPDFGALADNTDTLKKRYAQKCMGRECFKPTSINDTEFEAAEKINLTKLGFSKYTVLKRGRGRIRLVDLFYGYTTEICKEHNPRPCGTPPLLKGELIGRRGELWLVMKQQQKFPFSEGVDAEPLVALADGVAAAKGSAKTFSHTPSSRSACHPFILKGNYFGIVHALDLASCLALSDQPNNLRELYNTLHYCNLPPALKLKLISGMLTEHLVLGSVPGAELVSRVCQCVGYIRAVPVAEARCFALKASTPRQAAPATPLIEGNFEMLKYFLAQTEDDKGLNTNYEHKLTFKYGIRLVGDKLFFKPQTNSGKINLKLKIRDKRVHFLVSGHNRLVCNGMVLNNIDFINLSANKEEIKLEWV